MSLTVVGGGGGVGVGAKVGGTRTVGAGEVGGEGEGGDEDARTASLSFDGREGLVLVTSFV